MFETITWLVTNKCGLKCQYCNFVGRPINEVGIDDKIKALEIFKSWPESEKRFICLLGGDIIYMDDIEKFANALNESGLPYGFQTSCADYDTMYKIINKYNLKNLSISVDPFDMSDYSRTVKAINGLYWSGYAKAKDDNIDVHATLTLDRDNIKNAPKTVKLLSKLGIWSEITSVHWHKTYFDLVPDKEITKGFRPEDRELLQDITNELIQMKKDGYRIHSTIDFLKTWKDYAVDLDWRCENPVNAMVDADLSMRSCLHLPGKRVRKWSLLDLTHDKWNDFLEDWKMDQAEMCPNCFWDCQLEVEGQTMDEVQKWFDHEK